MLRWQLVARYHFIIIILSLILIILSLILVFPRRFFPNSLVYSKLPTEILDHVLALVRPNYNITFEGNFSFPKKGALALAQEKKKGGAHITPSECKRFWQILNGGSSQNAPMNCEL